MRRREFIALTTALGAYAFTARAQQSGRQKRIAIVSPSHTTEELRTIPYYKAFSDELSRLGFAEGQNLVVDRYSGKGQIDTYPDLAREVVAKNPDAIFTAALPMSLALRRATAKIPILTIVGDPVVSGLADSMARPGRNVTGVTIDAGVELHGKRLGLLREFRPNAARVAYLSSATAWKQPQAAMVREAAQKSGISLVHLDLGNKVDGIAYKSAFGSIDSVKADILLVSDEPEHLPNSRTLIDLATRARIPASYPFRDLVMAGGLMAYYRDLVDAFRQLAAQMAQILAGESPAEIPFRQPTKFMLSINAKAAQQIGVVVPPTLLASADEVIE